MLIVHRGRANRKGIVRSAERDKSMHLGILLIKAAKMPHGCTVRVKASRPIWSKPQTSQRSNQKIHEVGDCTLSWVPPHQGTEAAEARAGPIHPHILELSED